MLNLIRLFGLFLAAAISYPILKDRSIYYFLKLSGPSFIKLGQMLSARPDLVGIKLSRTLAELQDRLPPFSDAKVRKILEQEYGDNFSNIFAEFDFKSVASASIAQVHKAKTIDGKYVAVKVLRPKIIVIVARDIVTLKIIVKIIACFSTFFAKSIGDIVSLLQETARSELDLLQEAANASRLKEELVGVKGFYVPEIFWKLSTSKVLVLEWIDGIPFSDKKAIANASFDKKQISENLVISYFTQVYENGFFHADMHQGNLFLMKNGDIAAIDFGIMGRVDKKTRIALAEILIGFLNKDYLEVARIHVEARLVPEDVNIEALALSCRKIGETIVGNSVKEISLANLLAHLITMARDYKMVTRPELLLLQKTLLLVEGVGLMLDANLNMWELARPWMTQWARKNIGFDAKIRDVVVDLYRIFKKFLRNN